MTVQMTAKRLFCRGFQAVLKLGNYVMGYRMPEYWEGPGAVRTLGARLKEKGINDVLVVTGCGMVSRGQLQGMLEGFDAEGIRYTIQAFSRTDPDSEDVELGWKAYREGGCRAIVAIGGGSRIDCAKAIAAKAAQPRKCVAQLQGLLTVHRRVPPLIAIPTTSGAGSETTVAAVITDTATGRKAAINDPVLIPRYAVLDPELTASMSPYITAITGMDALVHAVESYTNHTYNTKLEDDLAKEAVRLIHANLLTAFTDGTDLAARQNLQRAAFFAGRSFTRGCVGYVHAIGHTLGSLYKIPHGLAMAVLLAPVMRSYGDAATARLARLAEVCGMEGHSDAEKASAFLDWVEKTNETMGLPRSFPQIREEDIPQMIAWADREANPLYPVPVVWGKKEFSGLIHAIRS